MHPVLQHWRYFAAWMGAWIPLAAILVLVADLSGHMTLAEAAATTVPAAIVLALVCLSPFYMCRALSLRSGRVARILINQLAAAVVLSAGVVLVGRFAASLLTPLFPGLDRRFAPAVPMLAVIALTIYLMAVALHYAALELEVSRRAEVLAREAQLRALKAQVNPHFLFNSLNSISALTAIDASQAREMCIRLADFLRTSLRLGERVTVPLAEELALTKMYLDVEQVRFGGRLRVSQEVGAGCAECDVPALIVQPLVENAVKHGVAMMAEGGEIVMQAARDRNVLKVSVSNPYDPEAPSAGRNGLGLRNIRERLESRYGSAARVEIKMDERSYEVTLTIPLRGPT